LHSIVGPIAEVSATMPFKRKIATRAVPKRSSRKLGSGKRKVAPDGQLKARKSRALQV
jgi:hypothetical protein